MTSNPVTMKPTKEEKKTHQKKEVSLSTFKRRDAAVRESAKIEVTTNVSGAAVRNGEMKPSLKTMYSEEQEKNHRQKKKRLNKTRKEVHVLKQNAKKDAAPATALYGYQLLVDVRDRGDQYAEARILDLVPDQKLLLVHYMGWNARFDAWVPLKQVKAHGSRCSVSIKKDISWNGKISLFVKREEVLQQKTTRTKQRGTLSPKEQKTTRKAPQSVTSKRKRHKDEMQETTQMELNARRTSKKVKTVTQPTMTSNYSKRTKLASTSSRRLSKRVQVAVGRIDEESVGKNESERADMVLDVEIQGREPSYDAGAVESECEEEDVTSPSRAKEGAIKWNSRSELDTDRLIKRQGKMERGTAANDPPNMKDTTVSADSTLISATATAHLSSRNGCSSVGSATREKLAAIFRRRVQQKQEMEKIILDQSSFQESLQDDLTALSDTASDAAGTQELEDNHRYVGSIQSAATEEYQRQLQLFYHHQHFLAHDLSMNVASGDDQSRIPLQGGMIDPRIIQERLTAMEEHRRQQAHVQAYYHQLIHLRERNVRALAATQAFVTSSATVWEKQLRAPHSEDGTSSITSWKEMMMMADSFETEKPSLIMEPANNAEATRSNAGKDHDETFKESESRTASSALDHDRARTASSNAVEETA
ncbi:hypothetical protein PsorP6_011077 [Peronosclerospora sorghi]|uniref:Uncharacterized protein n=1 Tax=Peronosclerospora sorghi TaxID=230839 RepID=A0ACC0VUY5_9STRA|nr:hypothetical protein PsorP6_011077 [Peronosclerospora sorghi]